MPKFSVGIYNKEVRRLLAEGRRHPDLADSWSDIHYVETWADDKREAWEKMQRRYPVSLGYTITDVLEER